MNAVEIEEALSTLALEPFDGAAFPYALLAALGNRDTTLKRLRKGDTNASDVAGGVLQRSNIHIAVCEPGAAGVTLNELEASPKTAQAKAKIILATDGTWLEVEDLISGKHVACDLPNFPDHFGLFLPLAGISTVKEIKDSPTDLRITGRLNKLYVELLRESPEWAKEAHRHDLNHFMARLVFCFFAEDTDVFQGTDLFTRTLEQISHSDGSNTHEVLETIFRAMTKQTLRVIVRPSSPNDIKGWLAYLRVLTQQKRQRQTARTSYLYFVPAGTDSNAVSGRQRQTVKLKDMAVRSPLPGNQAGRPGRDARRAVRSDGIGTMKAG